MATLIRFEAIPVAQNQHFYRATEKARLPGVCEAIADRSLYLYDVLQLCLRGAWELELGQFMPPVSLRHTVTELLELGLIELVDNPPPPPAMRDPLRRRAAPANQSRFDRPATMAA